MKDLHKREMAEGVFGLESPGIMVVQVVDTDGPAEGVKVAVEYHDESVTAMRSLEKFRDDVKFGGVGYYVYCNELAASCPLAYCRVGSHQDWSAWGYLNSRPPCLGYAKMLLSDHFRQELSMSDPSATSHSIATRFERAEAAAQAMAFACNPAAQFSPSEILSLVPPKDTPTWGILVDRVEVDHMPEVAAGGNLDDAFARLDADGATRGKASGRGVLVAVLDTGSSPSHPAFKSSVLRCVDATGTNPGGVDGNGHGAWCTSAIAGYDDSSPGAIYEGIARDAAVLSIQVLTAGGWGTDQMIARGVELAILAEADVISMSLGGSARMPETEGAIKRAKAKGIRVFAAAGNSGPGPNTVGYPGRLPEVNCVAATTTTSTLAPATFSSRGPEVDFAAPGVSLWGANARGGYRRISGTSMATPLAAGIYAGLLSLGLDGDGGIPESHRENCLSALQGTATGNTGGDRTHWYGWGLVQLARAAEQLTEPPPPPPPPPPPTGEPVKIVYRGDQVATMRATIDEVSVILDHLQAGQSVFITTE